MRVDVGGVGGERLLDAVAAGVIAQLAQQTADSRGPAGLEHVVERLEPLAGLERFDLGGVFGAVFRMNPLRSVPAGQQRDSGPHAAPAGPSCATCQPHYP